MINENLSAAVLERQCIFGINRKLSTSLMMMMRCMVLGADRLCKGCRKMQDITHVQFLTCPVEEENLFYIKLHIDVKIMGTV